MFKTVLNGLFQYSNILSRREQPPAIMSLCYGFRSSCVVCYYVQ